MKAVRTPGIPTNRNETFLSNHSVRVVAIMRIVAAKLSGRAQVLVSATGEASTGAAIQSPESSAASRRTFAVFFAIRRIGVFDATPPAGTDLTVDFAVAMLETLEAAEIVAAVAVRAVKIEFALPADAVDAIVVAAVGIEITFFLGAIVVDADIFAVAVSFIDAFDVGTLVVAGA